jgi:RNA polymerase sigma-70 factor (ECF subfamily)
LRLPRSDLTDDVVAAAAAADADALSTVYEALAPAVLGYLRLRGVDDPEGVTQDVFVKLLPQLPTVRGGAEGVRKLTFTIARARMIDAIRARSRTGIPVVYDVGNDRRAVSSAEDDAHAAMSVQRVRAVLEVLPDDQREVLTLRVVADLTIEQVAEIIGRSQGAVKQLQRRGMVALRAALDERRVTL